MKEPLVSKKRTPLSGKIRQKFIDVSGNEFYWDIHVKNVRGEGGSCLCYDVEVEKGPGNRQKMIMKQFYPDLANENEISARLEGTELIIDYVDRRPDILRLAERFEAAFQLQNELASQIDHVVKPSVNYFSGMTKLVLYEANSGETLDKFMEEFPENILKMLDAAAETADVLHQLHQAGYLHMDLKPENILWNGKQAKLFDFDASVSMKSHGAVRKIAHDGRESHRQTLAPELRNTEDKRPFLTPKVDVYTLGCILFQYVMGRFPTDSECMDMNAWKDQFHDKMHETYGDSFPFEKQEELAKILQKCICFARSMRYDNMECLVSDVRRLVQQIKNEENKRLKQADYNLLSGYVLDAHPVYKYKYKKEGKYYLDVTIMGDGEIRDYFVKNIFSIAQMADTVLNIRVIASDAKRYLEKLILQCPQLRDTTYIYLNSESETYISDSLNEKITLEPFANFYFVEGEMDQIHSDSRYIIFANEDVKKNKKDAETLVKLLETQPEKRVFVAYGKRGNGGCEVVTDVQTDNPLLDVQAFCCDANVTKQEKLFKTEIYRKALGVHTFYTKGWNEKMEASDIEKDLRAKDRNKDYYNLKSSLRAALSIKYKFDACGIPANYDNARVFYEKVVSQKDDRSKELFQKVTYLEHRSWMCFMIMNGYQRPTEEELESYFFKEGNDHRDKRNKLHPCISGSLLHPQKSLANLNHSEWNDRDVWKDEAYDGLDRMSLLIHAIADKRVRQMDLRDAFEAIEAYFQGEQKELWKQLKNLYERMKAGENDLNIIWDKNYTLADIYLKQIEAVKAQSILKEIQTEIKVIKERNLYHDYKESDADIINAIPRIMMGAKEEYQRIYKTISSNIGDMVISTVLIEPEELTVVTDYDDEVLAEQKKIIEEFLQKRGLGNTKVSQCRPEEIECSKSAKKTALDITGCDAALMMKLYRQGCLEKMHVIRCEDGKALPEENAEDVRYYTQPRHLTVQETLGLFQGKVTEEVDGNYMLSLNQVYQQLWNAYLEINNNVVWAEVIQFFNREERKNYWALPKKGGLIKITTCETSSVYTMLLKTCGIEGVLKELKDHGFIQSYILPPIDLEEGRIVLQCDEKIAKFVQDMVAKIRKDIGHRFCFCKEKDGYYIYDDTLIVDEFMTEKTIPSGSLRKAVIEMLTTLNKHGQMDQQEYIIRMTGGKSFVSKINDGKFEVCVKFASKAVKQCLLREGNLLEAFTFNSILQKGHFYDVKSNVILNWDSKKSVDVKNEIDVVCTKGVQTFFISCKQTRPEKEFLTEVKYFADHFGMNAKAIVVCSYEGTGREEFYDQKDSAILNRSRAMDVYFVNRALIGATDEDVKNGRLAKVIEAIANGDEHWWKAK